MQDFARDVFAKVEEFRNSAVHGDPAESRGCLLAAEALRWETLGGRSREGLASIAAHALFVSELNQGFPSSEADLSNALAMTEPMANQALAGRALDECASRCSVVGVPVHEAPATDTATMAVPEAGPASAAAPTLESLPPDGATCNLSGDST